MAHVRVQEVSFSSLENTRQWKVDVSEHDSLPSRSAVISDPFSQAEESSIRWYLEKHATQSPFELDRAHDAEAKLAHYGQQLWRMLDINVGHLKTISKINPVSTAPRLRLEIVSSPSTAVDEVSSIQSLHWELLERPGICSSLLLEVVRSSALEVIDQKPEISQLPATPRVQPASENSVKTFNILLVVARDLSQPEVASNEVDPSAAIRALLDVRNLLQERHGGERLHIEMVRPGTLDALSSHLDQVRRDRGPDFFDLVHLDVHGMIKKLRGVPTAFLNFAHPTQSDSIQPIAAAEVGMILKAHKIPTVVLNACQSARADKGAGSNIAESFLGLGVQNVIAMSFNILITGSRIFLWSFYNSLLLDGLDAVEATCLGRVALRSEQSRPARYGVNTNLQDWMVPVCYSSAKLGSLDRSLPSAVSTEPVKPTCTNTPCIGRGLQKMAFERQMIESPIIYLHGASQSGKSAMVKELCQEWYSTKFIDYYIRLDFCGIFETLGESLHSAMQTMGGNRSKSLAEPFSLHSSSNVEVVEFQGNCVLVLDSLDYPFNGGILAMLEERGMKKAIDDRKAFLKLLLLLQRSIASSAKRVYLILVGHHDDDWLKPHLKGLDFSSFQLLGLQMPFALSLAESLLPVNLRVVSNPSAEYEALVHIVNMLQRLPGVLKLILSSKTAGATTLVAFRDQLIDGRIVLSQEDVQSLMQTAESTSADRFPVMISYMLEQMGTLQKKVLKALGCFWEDGPFNLESYLHNLELRGIIQVAADQKKIPYTVVHMVRDLDCLHVVQLGGVVDIHPLFTLIARGSRQPRPNMHQIGSKVTETMRSMWGHLKIRPVAASSNRVEQTTNQDTSLFVDEVANKYTAQLMINHLYNLGIAHQAKFHRRSLNNVLGCITLSLNQEPPLTFENLPLELVANYTAVSRLMLTTPEQQLFASSCDALFQRLLLIPSFPAVDFSIITEALIITTHLASFYGPYQPRQNYRVEFTDAGIAMITAYEAQNGPMKHPSLMYKSLTYRFKAIDELIAGKEADADHWWWEMVRMQPQMDAALENPPAIEAWKNDPDFLALDTDMQERHKQALRAVGQETQSWKLLRTPQVWSVIKAAFRNQGSSAFAGFSPEFAPEAQQNLQSVYKVYDELGHGEEMRQFEEAFPTNFDVVSYGDRFSNPQTGSAYLEQAISLGNWLVAREAHLTMVKQALAQGQHRTAMTHLGQIMKLSDSVQPKDPGERNLQDELRDIYEEVATKGPENLELEVIIRMLRLFAERPNEADLGRPGFSSQAKRVAELLERGNNGLGSDAEADECEQFFKEQVQAFVPGLRLIEGEGELRRFFAARQKEKLAEMQREIVTRLSKMFAEAFSELAEEAEQAAESQKAGSSSPKPAEAEEEEAVVVVE